MFMDMLKSSFDLYLKELGTRFKFVKGTKAEKDDKIKYFEG